MSITYPLDTASLWKLCHFSSYEWDLNRFEAAQMTKEGRVIASRSAFPKWMGSGTLRDEVSIQNSVTFMAKFGMLRGSMGTFFAYDQRRPYPLMDPSGSILGASTVQVNAIAADRDKIALKGLPVGYVISAGDMISINYATSRWALIRAMETAVANGSGIAGQFYVESDVPVGVEFNDSVNLKEPACICRIVPGSIRNPSNDSGSATGLQFSWIQDR